MAEKIKLGLSKEYYEIIGEITVLWSQIEMDIDYFLAGLIKTDQYFGGAVISHIPAGVRVGLIENICKEMFGKDSDECKIILPLLIKIKSAYANRNSVAHGLWWGDEESGHARRLIFKRGAYEATGGIVTLDDLCSIRDELNNLNLALSVVGETLGIAPTDYTSQDIPSQQNDEKSHKEDQNQDTQTPPPESSQD